MTHSEETKLALHLERIDNKLGVLPKLEEQLTITNNSVDSIQKWRERMIGAYLTAAAVSGVFVIGLLWVVGEIVALNESVAVIEEKIN